MRNTIERGRFSFVIFKWNGRYIGICKELGFVEESTDFDIVKKKLTNGAIAVLEAVRKSSQNLEPSLNTSPTLRYRIYYFIAPLLGIIEYIKDSCRQSNNNSSEGFFAFRESVSSLIRTNA